MRKSHGKVKTNAWVRWKAFQRWTTKQCFTHAFRPFSHGQSGYTSESPRGKTSTASHCLAPVKSQEQDLDWHASFPSRSSVDRQDGADGCAVSDTGPVKTAADQMETDPGVESQGPGLEKSGRMVAFCDWNARFCDQKTWCSRNFAPKTRRPGASLRPDEHSSRPDSENKN